MCTLVILAFKRQRKVDLCEFKPTLIYMGNSKAAKPAYENLSQNKLIKKINE